MPGRSRLRNLVSLRVIFRPRRNSLSSNAPVRGGSRGTCARTSAASGVEPQLELSRPPHPPPTRQVRLTCVPGRKACGSVTSGPERGPAAACLF